MTVGPFLLLAVVVSIAALADRLLHLTCPADHLLVISGKKPRVLHPGGAGWRWPLVERVERLSLLPFEVELRFSGAYARGGIPFSAIATLQARISTSHVAQAVERLLGTSTKDQKRLLSQLGEGTFRQALADWSVSLEGGAQLEKQVLLLGRVEATKLGLSLESVRLLSLSDPAGRNYAPSLLEPARPSPSSSAAAERRLVEERWLARLRENHWASAGTLHTGLPKGGTVRDSSAKKDEGTEGVVHQQQRCSVTWSPSGLVAKSLDGEQLLGFEEGDCLSLHLSRGAERLSDSFWARWRGELPRARELLLVELRKGTARLRLAAECQPAQLEGLTLMQGVAGYREAGEGAQPLLGLLSSAVSLGATLALGTPMPMGQRVSLPSGVLLEATVLGTFVRVPACFGLRHRLYPASAFGLPEQRSSSGATRWVLPFLGSSRRHLELGAHPSPLVEQVERLLKGRESTS